MSDSLVGQQARQIRVVEPKDTAHAFGNEGVHVLGTPALVGWLEDVAATALKPVLEANQSSVGTYVEVHHMAPAAVDAEVTVTAVVLNVDDRRIDFEVAAHGKRRQIARGRHRRVIVETRPFLGIPEIRGQ